MVIFMNIVALFLTLLAGLFFVFGFVIAAFSKNKKKLSLFAVSLAFVVMLNLIVFDLIPEVIEIFNLTKFSVNIFIVAVLVLVGFFTLKILDLFIPDHHHEHHEHEINTKEHNSHVYHIGIVTLISLLLHNIIEGIAIYGLTIKAIESGLLMCIGVALHNIPLGIEIAIAIDFLENKKLSNKILLASLALSSLFGGIIVALFGGISEIILGVITSVTLGMLIYIAIFELLHEILTNRKHKEIYYGIITGVIIIIISLLL